MWQSYHKIELKNWRLEELFDKWGYVCSCCGTASPVCATKELALEAWNHRPEPFVDCVRCGKALGLSNIRCVECDDTRPAPPRPAPTPSSELEKAVEALKWAKGYIDDGTVENDTETPQHHCDYIHNPESGHCEFHQKYSEMCEIIAAYRAQVTKEGA